MSGQVIFSEDTFSFLSDLTSNNNKGWFTENKNRYENHLKTPLLAFIGSMAAKFDSISKQIVVDQRPNGGSMFRIYRDVRFSKDKSPYKTHGAAQFRHAMGKDVHAPGYYFHVGLEECIYGAGIWKPDSKSLSLIRNYIDENQEEWLRLTKNENFIQECTLTGESLKRQPKGFGADHPLINDLKRKDFIVMKNVNPADILSANVVESYADWCKVASPFMEFICRALKLPY
jgi:uncharacterized protein (TIGR02453 family)